MLNLRLHLPARRAVLTLGALYSAHVTIPRAVEAGPHRAPPAPVLTVATPLVATDVASATARTGTFRDESPEKYVGRVTSEGRGDATAVDAAFAVQDPDPFIDLALDKSHSGTFVVGQRGTYSLSVANIGSRTTNGPVTLTDQLPTGLSFVSATGNGWTCGVAGRLVSCTHAGTIAPNQTTTVTLVVSVSAAALPSVLNTAAVSTPNERSGVLGNNTDSDPTAVTATADLTIAKTATSAFVVGQHATYALAVSNPSLATVTGTTTVTDAIPAGLTFVSAVGAGWSCAHSAGTVTCTTQSPIAPGATTVITLTVAVGAAALPQVTNAATVTNPVDTNPGNDQSSVTTPVTPAGTPDLAMSKSATTAFLVGSNASYTLAVSNVGGAATTGTTTVTDVLPSGLSLVSAAGSGWSCAAAGATVTCTTQGPIAAGSNAPAILVTVAVAQTAGPNVTNSASVTTPDDSDPGNDTSTITTPVLIPLDLAIVKTASPMAIGASGTFTLAVTNVSSVSTVQPITVTDDLPAGVSFVSASGGAFTCSAVAQLVTCTRTASLLPGQTVSIALAVDVGAAVGTGFTNTAVVRTPGDGNTGNNSSSVVVSLGGGGTGGDPDLAMKKTLVGAVTSGQNATFLLTITNVGSGPTFAPITVTDVLPAGFTYVSATGTNWTCSSNGQTVTCVSPGPMAPGDKSLITVVAATSSTVRAFTNTAVAKTPGDGNPANDTDVLSVPASGVLFLDVAVSIVASAPSFTVGDPASYTLTVTNVGTLATVAPITVTDVVPIGLTPVSASGPGWTCTIAGQTITCVNAGPLAVGATTAITVIVTPTAAAVPEVTNATTVTTPGDADPTNDEDSVVTRVGGVIDVALAKSGPEVLVAGTNAVYALTVRNTGTIPTSGAITVTDTLPVGLSFVSGAGAGFTCAAAGQVVTCTRPAAPPLDPNAEITFDLTAAVSGAAAPSTTNRACVATPGDTNRVDDCGSSTGTHTVDIDLSLVAEPVGAFVVGGQGKYLLTVRSNGSAAATPPITVRDTLPAGLTFVSAAGAGWVCGAAAGVVTCTRGAALAPGAVTTIDLTVTLGAAAMPGVSTCARVTSDSETGPTTNNIGCATSPVTGVARLEVEKRVSSAEAQIGDVLDYTVLVRNTGSADLADALVVDDLPPGFSYVPRTARVRGASITEPTGAPGTHLTFAIGLVPRSAVTTMTYRVRLGATARLGENTNVAVATSRDGATVSAPSRATTRLSGGLFVERGAIVGKVFMECKCASAMQETGEFGIPGVRVYLEDGTSAVTDVEGKYSFYNVASRLHLVKIDRQSLPTGSVLVAHGNRNAFDGYTRFADVKAGELHKADFTEGSGSAEVTRQVVERRRVGEVGNAGTQIPDGARAPGVSSTGAAVTGDRAQPAVATPPSATPRDSIPIRYLDTGAGVQLSQDSLTGPVRNDEGYRPLLGTNTLTDYNSNLPATPLRAQAVQQGRRPASQGRVELDVPQRAIPADGQSLVTIRVRLLDAAGRSRNGRSPATLEASLGRWLGDDIGATEQGRQVTLEGGEGVFTLVAAPQPGRGEIRVTTPDGTVTVPIVFVPAARPLLAAGLLNARVDLRSLIKGGSALAPDADGFEESLRDWTFDEDSGKVRGGARGALLVKGRVFDDQVLTLSYDSERDRGRTYFRDIRPDEFFPVYGDASIREFDAQSRRRFYGRLDRGASYTLFGDFQTTRADERRVLTAYDRTLSGAVQHFEGRKGTATLFASQGRARQAVDELPGRGISGPYVLTHAQGGLVNSERVEIVTRDRNQPTMILSRVPLTRFADYTIEPLTGRLIFKAPVPSVDANLNPVSIRVTYETESVGSESFWVYGGDASLRVTAALEVGGTFAKDESALQGSQLAGLNATAKFGEGTYLSGELAQTDNEGTKGDAFRVELRHQSERLEGRLFAARSDSAFENRSSTFFGGRTELGGRFSVAMGDRTRLVAEALRTENNTALDGRRDGALFGIERQLNKSLRAEFGYRYAKESGEWNTAYPGNGNFFIRPNRELLDSDVSALRGRLNLTLPEKSRSSLFAEYERDVRDDSYRGAVGGEYVIASRARLYGRHEWLTSTQGAYGINEGGSAQYTVFGVDADYLKNTQMFSEYRARDAFHGRDAEASIGLRNRWAVAPGLLVNTSFERVAPLSPSAGSTAGFVQGDALAVTGAVEWTRPSLWKSTARLEFRNAADGDAFLGSLGYARKLSRDWTLLGRTLWDVFDAPQEQTRGWSQLGLAWRQTESNHWNALMRYENRLARASSYAGIERTENLAHILAALVNYQPTQRLTLSGRYAAKTARDDIGVLSTSSTAQLFMGRGVLDVTRRLDLGLIGSLLASDGVSERRYGLGGELGLILMKNLRVAGGYNVFGFTDKDLDSFGTTRRGAYVELGFKFDESLFGLGAAGATCDAACREAGRK